MRGDCCRTPRTHANPDLTVSEPNQALNSRSAAHHAAWRFLTTPIIGRRRFSLAAFRFVTNRSNAIKQRLTSGGKLLFGGIIVSGLLTIDVNKTPAYQVFSLLSALLLMAILMSLRFRARITISRPLPHHATIGQPVAYTVTIINQSAIAQDNLLVMETLPTVYPTLAEFQGSAEPRGKQRNWFDRRVAYHRYLWLQKKKQGFTTKAVTIPRMPTNGVCRVTLTLMPERRGRIELVGLTLMRPDPLGLILAYQFHPLPATLLVLPKRHPLPLGFQMPGTRHHLPGGVQSSAARGDAEEFVALRDYREGDSLRRVYWPGLARYNKLLVREHQNEYFTRYGLILDTFSTPDPQILEEAVSLAASFATLIDCGDALLDLLFVGDKAYHFTAGRSIAHLEQILEILACVSANTSEPFSRLANLLLSQAAVLSSCVVILLDWDSERRELLRQLDGLGLPLLVLLVVLPNQPEITPLPIWTHPASRLQIVPLGKAAEVLARLAL